MKDKFNTILLIVMLVIIVFLGWRIEVINNKNTKIVDDLNKSIVDNDVLKKEADGRYAKLVNFYDDEKDLKKELKKSNENLSDVVKKQNEKILSLTSAVITLQGVISEGGGKIDPVDSNKIDLALKYPNDANPFINWIGNVDRKSAYYKGEWSFGKLPLQIVLTEEQRGLWKSRLIGPDWLKVDSMSINSLPPEEYPIYEPKKLQFLVGGGYIKSLSTTGADGISIGAGVTLFDNHNLLLNATTNKEVSVSYYYKIKSLKKKK